MKRTIASFKMIGVLAPLAFLFGCGGATQTETVPTSDTQTPDPPARPEVTDSTAPREEPAGKTFLWQAQSESAPGKTVYLLGSVHMASEDFYPLDPVIEEAYDASDSLVVEVNMAAIPQKKMLQLVLSRAVLPPGQTLKSRLSPETWTKLEATLKKYDVPPETVIRFKPWFAALTLVTLRITEAGYKPALGIDRHFIGRKDKEIVELESAESQLSLFDDLPVELEELLLLDAIEGSLQSGGDLTKVMEAWQVGDVEVLREILFADVGKRPEFVPLYKRLLDDRNHAMVERIEALIAERSTLFVVVGAGHLVGDEGLVALFERKGYSVRQLEKRKR